MTRAIRGKFVFIVYVIFMVLLLLDLPLDIFRAPPQSFESSITQDCVGADHPDCISIETVELGPIVPFQVLSFSIQEIMREGSYKLWASGVGIYVYADDSLLFDYYIPISDFNRSEVPNYIIINESDNVRVEFKAALEDPDVLSTFQFGLTVSSPPLIMKHTQLFTFFAITIPLMLLSINYSNIRDYTANS